MPYENDTAQSGLVCANSSLYSSPCYARDADPMYRGYRVDEMDVGNSIARWRSRARDYLIAQRMALSSSERKRAAAAICHTLDHLIERLGPDVVSVYWPLRGEFNLRRWMQTLREGGIRVTLPVVVSQNSPLVFREWTPVSTMVCGVWNIPVPLRAVHLIPDVIIAPMVGYDARLFRLGYGGGYYDRTVANLRHQEYRPHLIGVAHSSLLLRSIYPQRHDIAMAHVATEKGLVPC